MPRRKTLTTGAPWVEVASTAKDWDALGPAAAGEMLVQLHIVRAFEEEVLALASEGLVHGPAHSSIGQEGGAVGSIMALRPGDQVNGSHRGHHQFVAKALAYLAQGRLAPERPFGDDVEEMLYRSLAEIMGLAPGYCRGRGGSMHLKWAEAGMLGTNAIVGGGVPLAAGAAFAHRRAAGPEKESDVVITCFGDGAVNIGAVLETMNLAAAWRLPLCFFIDNNQYAVSTTVEESTAETRLSARGPGFGIPSWRVDGMDPLAVRLATQEAVAHMRQGNGPTLIEAVSYRYFHQNGPLPGSAFGYRSKEEEAEWRARDPLERVGAEMKTRGWIDEGGLADLRLRAQDVMQATSARLTRMEGNRRRIVEALWPSPDFRDFGVRGDLSELAGARIVEREQFNGRLERKRFVDVIADTITRRMETDERVVVLGEDVHRLKGGTNGATRGLAARFPDRCLGTPISEEAFCGFAGGLALDGRHRPIVELMYADFVWVAADQLFNQIAKARHMYGGGDAVPLVLRTKVAIGTGYGSQHSMDPAGLFALSPGWRILAPSTAYDYVGLMNAALACDDPVLVIEHVDLYGREEEAPVDDLDYHLPIGRAKVVREGRDVTLLGYLTMVGAAIDACAATGVDGEVIDLRSLDRAGIDWETIERSVRKTNSVAILEEGPLGTSWGGWLADEINRRLFDWLDQPVMRVTGGEAAPSVSKVLEAATRAGRPDVEKLLGTMMAALGKPMTVTG